MNKFCHPAEWRGLVKYNPPATLRDDSNLVRRLLYFRKWILLMICFLSFPIYANNYYDEHAIGWHWYQDPLEIEPPKVLPPVPQNLDSIDRVHNAQRTLERALIAFVLRPW